MHLDPEEIEAYKKQHAEYKQDLADIIKKSDHEIPDFLVSPYGRDGGLARFNDKMSSDELFKLAKLIEQMADAKLYLERHEHEMKKEGLSI